MSSSPRGVGESRTYASITTRTTSAAKPTARPSNQGCPLRSFSLKFAKCERYVVASPTDTTATFARGNCLTTCRRGPTVANGILKELQEIEPAALPERDVRAGKPLLGGLLKFDIARAVVRVAVLACLDLAG